MNKGLLTLTVMLFVLEGYSQDPKEQVTQAIGNYVDAFYYGDSTKIIESVARNVVKFGYYIPKDKVGYEGEPMSFQEMLAYAARVGKKGPNSRVNSFPRKIEVFDVQDQTATGKLTAWWGTDYILLAKLNGKWMITNVLWQSPPK